MKLSMNRQSMLMKYWYVTLLVCILFIQLGCKLQEAFVIPTPKPMANWIRAWLEEPVCVPPCWNNILPGYTNIYDAQKMLEQEPSRYKITWPANHFDPTEPLDRSQLSWTFLEDLSGGSVDSAIQSYTVSTIFIHLNSQLFLQGIVTKYGAWDKVLIYHCDPLIFSWTCSIVLRKLQL
jgi:hypothetical protein